MIQIQKKIGPKGQIVIPKIIREMLGLTENQPIILEVEGKIVKILAFSQRDIVREWREIAKKEGMDVSKTVYGDKLYEEVFS